MLSEYQIEAHFRRLVDCLKLESEAEFARLSERRKEFRSEAAEKFGETILNLVIADQLPGLGGLQLLTLKRKSAAVPMPWHRLRVGTPVAVSAMDSHSNSVALSAVVSDRTHDSLQVAMTRVPDYTVLRVDLAVDEVARQRQLQAIQRAGSAQGRLAQLRKVMFGQRKPEFDSPRDCALPDYLNESQKNAIHFALSARDLAIIHGPPGTGKTTTLVAMIVQSVRDGSKVLACAPSNTAVDHLVEKLIDAGQRVVRIGHPARVGQRLQAYSLDGLVEQHESQSVAKALRRQAEDLLRQAEKWTRSRREVGERQHLRRAARDLEQEAKALERYMIRSILDQADIVCATTTFNDDYLSQRHFDLLVIDEACQSTEPGCWCPMPFADKVVLAGDPQQLPPTVLSPAAVAAGFDCSLMQRLMDMYGPQVSRLLDVQYRMHQQIMDFSSQQFYEGRLQADASVASHRLCDLSGVSDEPITQQPVQFFDTAGASWDEELEPNGLSKRNPHEADFAIRQVELLLAAGVDGWEIGVIAPYSAQVRWLRDRTRRSDNRAWQEVEIDTVDGFQGREKEVIVISLVRSNPQQEIGFLSDRRRMNVALTRARRKLIVIGDSATLGVHPFYQQFLDYVASIAAYRSVWEDM